MMKHIYHNSPILLVLEGGPGISYKNITTYININHKVVIMNMYILWKLVIKRGRAVPTSGVTSFYEGIYL